MSVVTSANLYIQLKLIYRLRLCYKVVKPKAGHAFRDTELTNPLINYNYSTIIINLQINTMLYTLPW